MKTFFACALTLVTSMLFANPSSMGRIFVPLFPGSVIGAGGSLWETTLVAYNPTDSEVAFFCNPAQAEPCHRIPPHGSVTFQPNDFPQSHPGAMVFEGTDGHFLFFAPITLTLRTRDVSRSGENAGTDLPLPTEDDFQAGQNAIVDVPSDPHFRQRLRIYATNVQVQETVRVQILDAATGEQLHEENVVLLPDALQGSTLYAPDGISVSYAELALQSYPTASSLRVLFSAVGPFSNVWLWGFITNTNNATGLVTISAPHVPKVIVRSVA